VLFTESTAVKAKFTKKPFLFDALQVGDEAQRRLTRGVEDLDFFIGDEAMEQKNPYSIKVS
jgi:hypothetical protein